ncbi:hypothetical protein AB5I41_10135 [Sphingomonas sp. MMS24-JH45]
MTFAGVLAAAWRLFRRDRDLVLRVAGPLVFLPAFAVQLLCDPIHGLPEGARNKAAMQAWMDAVIAWGRGIRSSTSRATSSVSSASRCSRCCSSRPAA